MNLLSSTNTKINLIVLSFSEGIYSLSSHVLVLK